jgi:hypothetical protein
LLTLVVSYGRERMDFTANRRDRCGIRAFTVGETGREQRIPRSASRGLAARGVSAIGYSLAARSVSAAADGGVYFTSVAIPLPNLKST